MKFTILRAHSMGGRWQNRWVLTWCRHQLLSITPSKTHICLVSHNPFHMRSLSKFLILAKISVRTMGTCLCERCEDASEKMTIKALRREEKKNSPKICQLVRGHPKLSFSNFKQMGFLFLCSQTYNYIERGQILPGYIVDSLIYFLSVFDC